MSHAPDDVTDEYVAQLLTKDAKEVATRFSRVGRADVFLKRPTTNAPKPNTRFLKSIIKETDNHNAALRAKEAQESRCRLRNLDHDARPWDDKPSGEARERPPKRRRLDSHHSRHEAEQSSQRSSKLHGERYVEERSRSPLRSSRSGGRPEEKRSRPHHVRAERRRDRSTDSIGRRNRRRERSDRRRRASPDVHTHRSRYSQSARQRRRSVGSSDRARKDYSRHRGGTKPAADGHEVERIGQSESQLQTPDDRSSTESDPLESIVGPAPPPSKPAIRARGRGALNATSSSAIDAHFARSYNPADDAHPDPDLEADDWDQALEALRDRQKWQQRGAERLKAAGFSEEEVSKWEKRSHQSEAGEKSEADVRWKGRGESREWDRGKVVDGDTITTQAEWGRLR